VSILLKAGYYEAGIFPAFSFECGFVPSFQSSAHRERLVFQTTGCRALFFARSILFLRFSAIIWQTAKQICQMNVL